MYVHRLSVRDIHMVVMGEGAIGLFFPPRLFFSFYLFFEIPAVRIHVCSSSVWLYRFQ